MNDYIYQRNGMKKHCFSLFFVMKKNEKQCFINLITRRSLVQIQLPQPYSHPNFDTKLGCIFMSIKCRKCEENGQSENDYFHNQPWNTLKSRKKLKWGVKGKTIEKAIVFFLALFSIEGCILKNNVDTRKTSIMDAFRAAVLWESQAVN